jgi:hypothetical protein
MLRSRDSSVDIENRIWAVRPRSWGLIPGRGKRFSLFRNVQTGSALSPISYTMDTGGRFFPEDRGEKLTTHLHLVPRSRMMELYLHSPFTSRCLLKPRDNFTFYYSCLHDTGVHFCLEHWYAVRSRHTLLQYLVWAYPYTR